MLLFSTLFTPSFLRADQNYLEVTASGNKLPGLAIAPAVSLGGGQNAEIAGVISEVLNFDLTLAGSFSIITAPPAASGGGIRPGEFDFAPWKAVGAAYLIKSGYTVSGNTITVELRLYDVLQGKSLAAKRYSGNRKELRWMAHAFSDETMLATTGVSGPFTGKIVYVSRSTGNKEINIMDYDGYNVQRITRNGSINLNPDISPKGREILFTSYKKGNPDLYRLVLFGGGEARISARHGINFTGAWSPDGGRIALSMSKDGNPEIYVIGTDGRQIAKLTDSNSINISPSWSPDGSRIAFVSDRAGGPQIFIMNSDGSNVHRLTRSGAYNVTPSWSPKGDRILYCRREGGGFQIHSISPDGSDDTQLTSEGRNENPRWSPDGRFVTFTSSRSGESIYVMRADGTGQTRVSRSGGGASQPVWSPRW